jgi:hypothetical protein
LGRRIAEDNSAVHEARHYSYWTSSQGTSPQLEG